MANIKAFN